MKRAILGLAAVLLVACPKDAPKKEESKDEPSSKSSDDKSSKKKAAKKSADDDDVTSKNDDESAKKKPAKSADDDEKQGDDDDDDSKKTAKVDDGGSKKAAKNDDGDLKKTKPANDDDDAPVDATAPGPVTIAPAIPPLEKMSWNHADVIGWSTDSTEFGYCNKGDGAGDTACTFRKINGGEDKLTDWANGDVDAKKTAAISARTKSKGYGATSAKSWPWGGEITLTWSVVKGNGLGLAAGGKLGGEQPVWTMQMAGGPDSLDVHVESFAMSPDRKWIGLVMHGTRGGPGAEFFDVQIKSSVAFAAQVYNDSGLRHHEKRDYEKATKWFGMAHAIDPRAELYAYNLACAWARLGDEKKAEKALRESIDLGGAKVKDRAKKDDDFDKVKTASWFVDATK